MSDEKFDFRCSECKKPFIKKNTIHIRCLSCTNSRKSNIKKMKLRICEFCSEEFEMVQQDQRFCTPSCRKKFEMNISNEKWIDKKKKKGQRIWIEDVTMTFL